MQKSIDDNRNLFVGYITAGYPDEEHFFHIIHECCRRGLPVLEIGFPSKDPYEDGEVIKKAHETVDEDAKMRRQVVEYALQFVGGRYQYGGVDPNKGVDCSGFTRYVLGKAASINLPHSSTGQSSYGKVVTEDQMQPGDLLFYAGGGGINHVALYIGDGEVVHASTEKTGIKTSPYDYRKPVKIVSLLS